MIIWGGTANTGGEFLNDGGRYDPEHDSWKPMSTVGAPWPRVEHTATWIGTELIIYGFYRPSMLTPEDVSNAKSCIAGAYNPTSDTWRSISNQDDVMYHSSIWTGHQMIVFGGFFPSYLIPDGKIFTPEGEGKWENLPRPPW